jgi:hypothetical protein
MSTYSKTQLKSLYGLTGTQFPDNTTGLITEIIMRTFGENEVDSFLNLVDDLQLLTTASGTDTYAVTGGITSYVAGFGIFVKFTNANTGAATLNVNTLGAKAIKKNGAVALAAGDISAGQIVLLVYDGTNFQVVGGGGGGNRFIGTHDASGNTLPNTNLTPGNEWYISVTGSLDPGDGSGSQVVVVGTIIKFISTGLWRFIQ